MSTYESLKYFVTVHDDTGVAGLWTTADLQPNSCTSLFRYPELASCERLRCREKVMLRL